MGWSEGQPYQREDHMVHKSKDYKHAKIACLYKPCGSLSTLGLPIGELVGLLLQMTYTVQFL